MDWTQEVLPEEAGQFGLRTDLDGTRSDLFYTCDSEQAVELHGGRSSGGSYSVEFGYSPAMLMWPGGEPKEELGWYSAGSQSGTWTAGGSSGALSGSFSSQWTITGVGLTYDLEDGTTLTDCVTWTRQSETTTMGSTVATDELGIYCGSLYGLVWNDVVTTTTTSGGPPLVAESWTRLTGLTVP